MSTPTRWLVTCACSGLLAASACFEDPIASTDGNNDEETGDGDGDPGDGDGDGDTGDGDGDGEPGDGDGDGESGDGDGEPGDGDGDGTCDEMCGGATCVDLDTDSLNCGECGNACPALTLCGEGMCKPEKYVFVTDAKFQGNFGGLDPDTICNGAAMNAFLPGFYRAWFSTANATPADWSVSDGVYRLRQSGAVAYSWADLIDGTLASPINRNEFGDQLLSLPACNNAVPYAVWTGTRADGTLEGPNCNDWGTNQDSAQGRVGHAGATDPKWSAAECTASCGTALPIYCVQQ